MKESLFEILARLLRLDIIEFWTLVSILTRHYYLLVCIRFKDNAQLYVILYVIGYSRLDGITGN